MALTIDDLRILQRPFNRADHEFTRGFAYASEEAITARIEEVDPSWAFDVLDIHYQNNQAVVNARLTIKDVSRTNVGMAALTTTNKDTGVISDGADPAKSAATDALKRAARLFGITRYLLKAPKETQGFDKWLADLQKAAPNALQATPAPLTVVDKLATTKTPQQAVQGQGNGKPATYADVDENGEIVLPPQSGTNGKLDMLIVRRDTLRYYANEHEQEASIAKLWRDGVLMNDLTTAQAIKAVRDYREQKAARWTAGGAQADAFLEWALGTLETKKAIKDALQAAVDYKVSLLADWRGTETEARGAVIAAFCDYDMERIAGMVAGLVKLSDAERLELTVAAQDIAGRVTLKQAFPEQVTTSGK